MVSAKFHFREINWVIYFPATGNEGRAFEKYGVSFRDREKGISQPGPKINLEDVLNQKRISENYPHTIGYFLESSGRGKIWLPDYLKTKTVNNKVEFLSFLSELGL